MQHTSSKQDKKQRQVTRTGTIVATTKIKIGQDILIAYGGVGEKRHFARDHNHQPQTIIHPFVDEVPPPTTGTGNDRPRGPGPIWEYTHMVGPRGRPAAPTRRSVVNTLQSSARLSARALTAK
eukprot:scaffold17_cov124-Isochrysis_galbana.AAC.4